jgi:AcrR family transcriptional regulator
MAKKKSQSSARQRIIETAERLFYAEGVRAVGIDRIIAEAEVAKMTLYNHFQSKDDLILAVLHYRDEKINGFFESAVERYAEQGMDRLSAFFAALDEWFRSKGFRGCAFINAVVELADADHPAAAFSAKHKEIFHQMINDIVTEQYGTKAKAFVPAVCLMVEGAIVTAVMEGNPNSASVAKQAALTLVTSADDEEE